LTSLFLHRNQLFIGIDGFSTSLLLVETIYLEKERVWLDSLLRYTFVETQENQENDEKSVV
jgi:hypothetical protein